MTGLGRRGVGAALVTSTLSYLGLLGVSPDPFTVESVNPDGELLEPWDSDANSSAPPSCRWLDGNVKYTSETCSWFIINRRSSTPPAAFDRALRCAALAGTECILSPEVGLSTPACFIVGNTVTRMILAPRLLDQENPQSANVRVTNPGNHMSTKTLRLYSTVRVEYLDASTRRVAIESFSGNEAYCVQLLRLAFNESCWTALD